MHDVENLPADRQTGQAGTHSLMALRVGFRVCVRGVRTKKAPDTGTPDTGKHLDNILKARFEERADAYLTKPFEKEALFGDSAHATWA